MSWYINPVSGKWHDYTFTNTKLYIDGILRGERTEDTEGRFTFYPKALTAEEIKEMDENDKRLEEAANKVSGPNNIKELAREILRIMETPPNDEYKQMLWESTTKLLKLIDKAELKEQAVIQDKKGYYLFFPDAQPTLAEIAWTVVNAYGFDGEVTTQKIQALKAALEREKK